MRLAAPPTPWTEAGPRVERLEVSAYAIPTEAPESDGTLEWDRTTLVLVEVAGGGQSGLGYTYADAAAASLIRGRLAELAVGTDAFAVAGTGAALRRSLRNLGTSGIAATALSAVDNALWDLKARLLGVSLAELLGPLRAAVPVYGSGGFTSLSLDRLCAQLAGWVGEGIPRVKLKVGRRPEQDLERVAAARAAIGGEAELFVDANGAYRRKQALEFAAGFDHFGVRWFEEPVPSNDLEGLRLLRDRAPAGMSIVAGEYGFEPADFRRLLTAGAVDVLQADATRCGGITGFLKAAALAEAFAIPLSSHGAPALHRHAACAAPGFTVLEYFHDHARIEELLFEGAGRPAGGMLAPAPGEPGLGLLFRRADAAPYAL